METLIEAMRIIQNMCDKNEDCGECSIYKYRCECLLNGFPCDWNLNDIRETLAEMEKEK